jgi:hypothetical protein
MENEGKKDAPGGVVGVSPETMPPACEFRHSPDVGCSGLERFEIQICDLSPIKTTMCRRGAWLTMKALDKRCRPYGVKQVWPVQ